ncbi:class I SAM-dependent methyltransferase [Streptococcus gallolyticus]|uniref:class I SAM-dependent methyltransferase n=1 Tax=Streptococcus hepaticus TaxID=3349163 RepID=UPI001C97D672|nr:class I SAM-dependent methyltransferase [Streptococcus gallolyticus]MBY5040074.1 class I SAM-dependent methyltransferase [Streptococcus gallolyticus]
MKNYQEMNQETIDRWVEEGWEWGIPVSHETFLDAKKGTWDVLLTPTVSVPHDWFGDLKGKKVLGLASGGGQQMPIFTALGATCTVLDYSGKQIESERLVAEREGYEIEAIQGDMTKPLPFEDETFDLIFHPVSNCYVKDVEPIFAEAYRVLKKGGIFLGGFDNGVNYLVDENEEKIIWAMPFDPTTDEKARAFMEVEDCGMQFSHTLEEQIGGQLKAGFLLQDLYEDTNGVGRLHELNIKTFIATKAVK